jgi:hypothetical protein
MMADNYRLAFDLATTPDRWSSGAMIPLFIIAGAGLVSAVISKKMAKKLWGVVFFLFVGSIAAYSTYEHYSQLSTYKSLERSGKLSITEGCLQGFHPMREGGHEDELVRVNGKQFSYSDYDVSSIHFNNTESHGGPIHADSAVKIWYTGNNIIRLEVRDHACAKAPDLPQPD